MRLKIEKLVYGGSGMGFADGMPVFVPGTVAGDEVECEAVKKQKNYVEARLVKIITPSPNRVLPKCEYFGRCGGCQWQYIDYAAQMLWKQLIVEEQLSRIGKIKDPRVLPTIPSPKIWKYRGRVKLHTDAKGRKGFYALASHDIVEIKDCLIADISKDGGEFFTQVNPSQNENLKSLVSELVKERKAGSALELYCGNGNLTFAFADLVEIIEASDSDKNAIAHAKEMSSKNKISNIVFEAASGKKALEKMISKKREFDLLVIDPPRDGCKDIIKYITKMKFKDIIYVSCNPSTLARDINELAKSGYKLVSCQPIDMFPQTYHIESVSLITV